MISHILNFILGFCTGLLYIYMMIYFKNPIITMILLLTFLAMQVSWSNHRYRKSRYIGVLIGIMSPLIIKVILT